MAIYPEDKIIPEGFTTDEFLIRPLRTSDVKADYEALMQSREMLHIWDQSEWPEDDFTTEDNLSDLQDHQDEHEARESFTFTVMDPSDRTCLGCIYIYGLKGILDALSSEKADLGSVGELDIYVAFWVRSSRLADQLDQRLLRSLAEWLDTEWAFEQIAWGTNTADQHQRDLFSEAELVEQWRFPIADSDESYLLFVQGSVES